MKIILTSLNSRYSHSSIGLRYIYANLHELQKNTEILEFSINDALQSITEKLLACTPDIIGIGTYIWNATEVSQLIHVIKKVSPKTKIVLGGPEVSYEPFRVNFDDADFFIQGEGENSFYNLCKAIKENNEPKEKIIKIDTPNLKNIKLPYEYYTDEDIQNRYI